MFHATENAIEKHQTTQSLRQVLCFHGVAAERFSPPGRPKEATSPLESVYCFRETMVTL